MQYYGERFAKAVDEVLENKSLSLEGQKIADPMNHKMLTRHS